MTRQFTIGQLAELAGVPRKTIRYYEEVGVLPPPSRSGARYRIYSDIDVRRVELVRRARALDMGLAEVRELVEWASTGTCKISKSVSRACYTGSWKKWTIGLRTWSI